MKMAKESKLCKKLKTATQPLYCNTRVFSCSVAEILVNSFWAANLHFSSNTRLKRKKIIHKASSKLFGSFVQNFAFFCVCCDILFDGSNAFPFVLCAEVLVVHFLGGKTLCPRSRFANIWSPRQFIQFWKRGKGTATGSRSILTFRCICARPSSTAGAARGAGTGRPSHKACLRRCRGVHRQGPPEPRRVHRVVVCVPYPGRVFGHQSPAAFPHSPGLGLGFRPKFRPKITPQI